LSFLGHAKEIGHIGVNGLSLIVSQISALCDNWPVTTIILTCQPASDLL